MKKIVSIISAIALGLALTGCSKVPADDFSDLELTRAGITNRKHYFDLESLEKDCDVMVVGRFTGDAVQDVEYTYNSYFNKDVVSGVVSFNSVKVTKVLMGDVKVGDKLKISQEYGVVDGSLITFSDLTPMQNGDEWVFFLGFDSNLQNSYWCVGDSDGRYPTKNVKSNRAFPLSEYSELGVYDEKDFKRNIYEELVEKYDI